MTAIGFGGIRVRCVLEVKVYESVDSPAAGGIRILSKIPLRGARRATIKGFTPREAGLRAHSKITSHFNISASGHLQLLLNREILEIAHYFCGFTQSQQLNMT